MKRKNQLNVISRHFEISEPSPEEMAEAVNVAAVIRGGGTIAHWAQSLNTVARKK